jgi:hypothetical protein
MTSTSPRGTSQASTHDPSARGLHASGRRTARGVAVTSLAVLALGVLGACGTSRAQDTTAPPSTPTPTVTPSSPDATPTAEHSASQAPSKTPSSSATTTPPSSTPPDPDAPTAPVFYVVDTPSGPRLSEELRTVPSHGKLAAALTQLQQPPADPDYRTYYHPGDFGSVTFDGNAYTVQLTNTDLEKAGALSPSQATLAAQQLAYTLDTVAQGQGAPTRVVVDGKPVTLFGLSTDPGIVPGPQLKTLSLSTVLTPMQGQQVSGQLKASGMASAVEANVTWSIKDSSGKVVKKGFATAAGWQGGVYPWHTTIDVSALPAGSYVFSASSGDPSNGEGPAPTVDTKSFTVTG